MKAVLLALLIVDAFVFLIAFLTGNEGWVVNSQVGFISSSFVMLGSMISYRSMVQARLNVGAIPDDEQDTLDKLEDPYDLYDEEKKDDANKTLVEVVKEERENLKKNRRSFWEATKDSKASLSFYRLGAYAFLIFGFFYLNSNKLLDISAYLLGLALPTVVVVVMLMRENNES